MSRITLISINLSSITTEGLSIKDSPSVVSSYINILLFQKKHGKQEQQDGRE